MDEPLAEPGPTPLQEAPPSADWDAFGAPAPAAASGPASPSTTSWSAFDHAAPAVTAAHVTSHHQLPQPQQVVQSQQHLQQQSQHHLQRPPVQQQQQAAADTGGSWAVFGDSNSQAQQFQQPLQAQPEVMALQQQLKQQQQQQQPHAPEPVAAPPPKPAPRQELPLVSTALSASAHISFCTFAVTPVSSRLACAASNISMLNLVAEDACS